VLLSLHVHVCATCCAEPPRAHVRRASVPPRAQVLLLDCKTSSGVQMTASSTQLLRAEVSQLTHQVRSFDLGWRRVRQNATQARMKRIHTSWLVQIRLKREVGLRTLLARSGKSNGRVPEVQAQSLQGGSWRQCPSLGAEGAGDTPFSAAIYALL
jgi:hypothetical protein